ncbi:MAG: lysylphosphatidylglycerol synthase transmembrane domain-containing protein [Candidatus Pseudobacter hemicellulosilyticus]|uniref:Lysylphosphatidylglycerol synthase transmembrane domain-containing protein n=1 Tax=Candidatus Pseudobacter hemicellulosilyticus TaxID=3121375 RepID=A0AAJ6BGJ1_9BACT|nr:MAG: lysylphosphatidylglycerol synthase transmembrane domain-containing protein [Pseudobacter sp.]
MNKKLVSLLQYLFFIGLGLFLVWWSIRGIKPEEWPLIKNSLRKANYWLLIPVVIALLASHLSRAVRWKILMEPLGYKPRVSNTYFAVLIGYMANLAVPRLGEVLKCTILARYEKVPADKLVGTIVAERAFDMICLLIIMVLTIVTQADLITDFLYSKLNEYFGGKAKGFSTGILVIVGLIFLLMAAGTWFVFKKLSHISFVAKIKRVLLGIWQGLTSVRHLKNKGWFLFHSAFIWAMYFASVQIGMFALQETSGFGPLPSLTVLFTGSIAMIITPSGIGAYPKLVLETMQLYGLNAAYGWAFGWLLWTVQFFQMLICGLIALALLAVFNKQKDSNAKSGHHTNENIIPAGTATPAGPVADQ